MLGAIIGDMVGSVYEFNNIRAQIFLCLGRTLFLLTILL